MYQVTVVPMGTVIVACEKAKFAISNSMVAGMELGVGSGADDGTGAGGSSGAGDDP